MKALNGFLITQRLMTLKDTCGYIMLACDHHRFLFDYSSWWQEW